MLICESSNVVNREEKTVKKTRVLQCGINFYKTNNLQIKLDLAYSLTTASSLASRQFSPSRQIFGCSLTVKTTISKVMNNYNLIFA